MVGRAAFGVISRCGPRPDFNGLQSRQRDATGSCPSLRSAAESTIFSRGGSTAAAGAKLAPAALEH
jgi:hypothetical protein